MEQKGSSKFQLLAFAVQKKGQGLEPTRLGFIRKVSHLVSKNRRGKGGETQLQARWEEAVVLPIC